MQKACAECGDSFKGRSDKKFARVAGGIPLINGKNNSSIIKFKRININASKNVKFWSNSILMVRPLFPARNFVILGSTLTILPMFTGQKKVLYITSVTSRDTWLLMLTSLPWSEERRINKWLN